MSDTRTQRNVFAGHHIRRLGEYRKDSAWIESRLRAQGAWLVPVWQRRSLLAPDGRAVLLEPDDPLLAGAGEPILLGEWTDRLCFAADLGRAEPAPAAAKAHGKFASLRSVGAVTPADEAALLAYAQAIVLWQRRHRYCGFCGAPTASRDAGHVLACTNTGDCGKPQFPRSDPAIIVLVTHGDRALLGRQPSWPDGLYSTIAGFVEPGESLESAVLREVAEETGVEAAEVSYHSSQPWPFPSSLMIGFHAEARSTDIELRDRELEDARWFSRDEIIAGVEQGLPRLPAAISIAFRLVESWFDAGSDRLLADLVAPRHDPKRRRG